MAQTLTSITLTAPASDPNLAAGLTFQMSCTYVQSGHGGEESVSLHWEYATASGGPYSAIPVSGGPLRVASNPTSGTDSGLTHSATVTAVTPGTYYVHIRGVGNSSANEFGHGDQIVTITAAGVSGLLAAQEAGSDLAAASGQVSVDGAVLVAELGADGASITGSVSVSGQLAAQDTGPDAFSGVGTVGSGDVTGALAAQETGPDVFGGTGTVAVKLAKRRNTHRPQQRLAGSERRRMAVGRA